jgi:pimeloyl-ACP methyl ester carboxylesterase
MHGRGSGGRTRSGSGAVEQCHHAGMLPRRGYVDSPWGQLHHVRAGSGRTLLLLHQTPRSADEFAELVPLLAARFDVIAMDMVGFGASADAPAQTIDVLAGAAIALLDALGVTTSAVLGHHTGAVVALELAASAPQRIDALVLSAPPWVDAAARAARAAAPIPVDTAARRETAATSSHYGTNAGPTIRRPRQRCSIATCAMLCARASTRPQATARWANIGWSSGSVSSAHRCCCWARRPTRSRSRTSTMFGMPYAQHARFARMSSPAAPSP